MSLNGYFFLPRFVRPVAAVMVAGSWPLCDPSLVAPAFFCAHRRLSPRLNLVEAADDRTGRQIAPAEAPKTPSDYSSDRPRGGHEN